MTTRIIGDGGHARCLADLTGFPITSQGEDPVSEDKIVIGFGDPKKRAAVWLRYNDRKFPVLNLSGRAFSAADADGPPGVQLMPGAIVMPSVRLGKNVLVNTGASIDHDCRIGDHSVISPGATICGNVTLGERCFVGAGATVVQGVKLDADTFVPAGALVVGQNDMRVPIRVVLSIGGYSSTDRAAQAMG